MGLPTLSELGLKDKRKHIPDDVKASIKAELDSGTTNMAELSRKYGVSVGTIRYIRNPNYIKTMIKESRKRTGKRTYNKKIQERYMKDIRLRKETKIKELLKYYKEQEG